METTEDSHILIVDDEQTILLLLSRALTAYGHLIVTAETVAEAIEQVTNREFDLLLIDKNLPDGSGLDIIAKVREQNHRSEAILITGYSDTESAIQAVALDVFRYVRKPFDLDALKLDIDSALERRRLRQDLAGRTRDLEQTNKELWDALQRIYESERRTRQAERLANIGYLAAGVAHEINNPLSLLSMTIPFVTNEVAALAEQIDRTEAFNPLRAPIKQIAASVKPTQEAVEFLLRLASDLHSLGRTEKQDPKPVKLVEVAGSAARLVRHQLKYKAAVIVDVDEDLHVNGHASRLVQVFINLLTNAAKAIQRGGPSDNTISLSAQAVQDEVVIRVSDTGVGISEEHLDKIFKPFFSFSLKDEDQGSGIGLALVREIVDDHGGHISVTSKKGKGTIFTIRLPELVTEAASPAIVHTTANEMSRTKRQILFYDTESFNLTTYEESFGTMHDVLVASTLDQTMDKVRAHSDTLDALVCDIGNDPDFLMGFLELTHRWPDLKGRFIFIGNAGAPLSEAKARGYKVLQKPVRPAVLLGTIYKLPPRRAADTVPPKQPKK
ncbi:MAG: ATP-binding protein [Myxococcota bacterium]|nr:ATP-binding protein [Myxococcota bacterium]